MHKERRFHLGLTRHWCLRMSARAPSQTWRERWHKRFHQVIQSVRSGYAPDRSEMRANIRLPPWRIAAACTRCFVSDSHLQMRSRVIAWKKEASRRCASWRWGWYWTVQRMKPNGGIKLRSGSLKKPIFLSLCFLMVAEPERGQEATEFPLTSEVHVCAIRLTRRNRS